MGFVIEKMSAISSGEKLTWKLGAYISILQIVTKMIEIP
jgi:hypothetical protein